MEIEICTFKRPTMETVFSIESNGETSRYHPIVRYLTIVNLTIESPDPNYVDNYSIGDYDAVRDETRIDCENTIDYDTLGVLAVLKSGFITLKQAKGEEVINLIIKRTLMFTTGPYTVIERYTLLTKAKVT